MKEVKKSKVVNKALQQKIASKKKAIQSKQIVKK